MQADAFKHQTLAGERTQLARYGAACRLLSRPVRMVEIERAVTALDLDAPPAAVCLRGRTRLRRARRIGVFTGSFNPLTTAHVALADAARTQARLDVLVWAIAAITVDKERVTRAALADRLAQLVTFARQSDDAVVLFNRGLYVDQARALRALAPRGAALTILVGFDKIVQIFDAHYYADREAALCALFAAADLLVAPRAGEGGGALRALLDVPANRVYAPHVALLEVPPAHAYESSTAARTLAADAEAHTAELVRLLPPEALALVATGAYAPLTSSTGQDYTLRQQWLTVLQDVPPETLRHLPALPTLIALAQGEHGVQAQGTLAARQTHLQPPGAALALLESIGALRAVGD
jgi:nicotinic acid mononucleotide adenylyltransferase